MGRKPKKAREPRAPAVPVLQSIVPLGAVPGRLQAAVSGVLREWGYSWRDVSFAGTAALRVGGSSQLAPEPDEVWILAVTAAPVDVGDELDSASGRVAGVSLSAFSGGVIPAVPYQGRVYEYLGRRGGGGSPEPSPPSAPSTTPEMEPAAPDQRG